MLDAAIKYVDELKDKMLDTWFNEKYKYWNFNMYYSDIEISNETWREHQFVSIRDDEIIGYICYEVNRESNSCMGLGVINFSDDKMTFGRDLKQAITDIFEKFQFNKLKFSVVVGNPVEKSYDRMIRRYGGRIVGIFRQDTRLIDGNLYDVKQYEILRNEYLAFKSRKETNMNQTKLNCSLNDTTRLRNLILGNPELPILIFCGEEAWSGDWDYTQADVDEGSIQELTQYNGEWVDRNDYEARLSDNLCDEEEYEDLSPEEFEKMVKQKVSEAEFVEAIVIYVG